MSYVENENTRNTGGTSGSEELLLEDLKELKKKLQEKSNEKDSLHRRGMKVEGEERTMLFKQAALCAKEVAQIRKQINRISRKLRAK